MVEFLRELQRRKVLRVAVGYAAASWLIVQVLETLFEIFDLPDEWIQWLVIALLILVVPVLALSWTFGLSVTGIATQTDLDRGAARPRSESRGFDKFIIAALSIAVVWFAADKFLLSGGLAMSDRSIAVMPFVDLSAGRDAGYFGDGFADDLLNHLARQPKLRVAARRSSFSFRESGLPINEIASRLNVVYVLEGSIRSIGERVQVNAQLVSAKDGFNVWSDAFDREIGDIFTVKNEILAQVLAALELTGPDEKDRGDPASVEAYVLRLRADYRSLEATKEGRRDAIALYRQALALEPNYAHAWANLSTTYVNTSNAGDMNRADAYRNARDAAVRAIDSDPSYAGGYKALSTVNRYFEADMEAAVVHLQRALDADPTSLGLVSEAGIVMLNIGQLEDAVRLQEYVVARAPVDATSAWNLALRYRYVDRLADAERMYRRAAELSPEVFSLDYQIGETLLLMQRYDEALEYFEQEPDEAYRQKGIALAQHALGNRAASDEALAALIDGYADQWPSEIAHVYAYRGELDAAFEWLDREFDKYGPGGWGEWQLQRLYDNLRGDPRWLAFLRRTGTAPEDLAGLAVRLPSGIF